MMTEISAALLLTLLCEVNPLLLGISTAAAGAHEATAIWDVRAAVDGGREVRPAEQHIRSFLESLSFMAMSALLCLHRDQVNDVWQGQAGPAAWRLRLRRQRLPARLPGRGREPDRRAVRGGTMPLRQDQEAPGGALGGALSRSDPGGTGIRRRRCGRGFSYLGPDTAVIKDPRTLARIKAW